ncbi:MAG: HAD hydrolase-like protein, partial [Rhodospirillaceae bacterium]|nr:HAD hydrolase-like protein [Rhodospirillaceae bacterium]
AEIGGPVHLIGKPEGLIYACCLAERGQPDPGRVLAVGDSLDHDVLGGNRAGLLTVLVAGGVLAGALGRAPSRAALAEAVRRLAPDAARQPLWVLPALAW